MNNIKIVDETACVMFLDNDGNYNSSFFINQYYYQYINRKQKEGLKQALSKVDREFLELWLKDDDILYLTFLSDGKQLVDIIYNDGSRQIRNTIEVVDTMDNYEFTMLHDFLEVK